MNTVTVCLRAEVIEATNRDNASSGVTHTAPKRKLNNPHSFDRFKGTELEEDTQEHYTVCRLRGGQGGVEKLSLGCGCWHILLNLKLYLFFGVILVSSQKQ